MSQKAIRISSSKKNKLCRSGSETVFNDFCIVTSVVLAANHRAIC